MLNDAASINIAYMVDTLDTSHLEISPLNNTAYRNMNSMVVTLDTSHLEISPLNDDKGKNMAFMLSGMAETSQDPIGPCGPLEQSKSFSVRHSTMAALSSASDVRANAAVAHYNRGYTSGVKMGVLIMIRVTFSLTNRVRGWGQGQREG